MKKYLSVTIAACLVLLALSACGTKEQTQTSDSDKPKAEPFEIAVIPAQTQGQMKEAMDKLQTLLQEKLAMPVSVKEYPDYNGVVEAMNFGHVDMAFFGPLTYVIAHHKSGAEAIITQLVKGKPYYHSYIIAHKDSPWNSLDELLKESSKLSFAFGDPNSTSGSLVPGIELKNRGVYETAEKHSFANLKFTGSHDVTALAVQNKQVDAGAIDSAIYEGLVEQKKVDGSQIKVLWQSDKLFQYPWAVKKGTDPELVKKLQEAFVGITDETILKGFAISGFAAASNADYEPIRLAAEKEGKLK
ncbi:phosphate/phosphite/phosphonate ABC transporter substrate-binding protein [Paenibacillus turpanensis]|uniref:phosphate/phosphite/phosphonate ABC transporter substrate-binding protein n=1 Tax=Paenibacillus turpanensis TaxID=2689078 RepID=UPI00140B81A1